MTQAQKPCVKFTWQLPSRGTPDFCFVILEQCDIRRYHLILDNIRPNSFGKLHDDITGQGREVLRSVVAQVW